VVWRWKVSSDGLGSIRTGSVQIASRHEPVLIRSDHWKAKPVPRFGTSSPPLKVRSDIKKLRQNVGASTLLAVNLTAEPPSERNEGSGGPRVGTSCPRTASQAHILMDTTRCRVSTHYITTSCRVSTHYSVVEIHGRIGYGHAPSVFGIAGSLTTLLSGL
jgi:hypothetical protein